MADIGRYQKYKEAVVDSCSRVIVGKEEQITLLLTCFVCGGHVLLEDTPGTGKTMLLRAFAATTGGGFRRIQFTPDLLPSDLTGINFYNPKSGEFEFRPGPLFANAILADEINRATPRTQSALLEVMEEHQVTVDGTTYPVPEPFMVMATQNPLESYGTFPLPDAQVDRFFMRLSLGYMKREEEAKVLRGKPAAELLSQVTPAVTEQETAYVRSAYRDVRMSDDCMNYLLDIVEATREKTSPVTAVSVRGAKALYAASQVTALFAGRDYCIPEDIKYAAPYVLLHRIAAGADAREETAEKFMTNILSGVTVPLETKA